MLQTLSIWGCLYSAARGRERPQSQAVELAVNDRYEDLPIIVVSGLTAGILLLLLGQFFLTSGVMIGLLLGLTLYLAPEARLGIATFLYKVKAWLKHSTGLLNYLQTPCTYQVYLRAIIARENLLNSLQGISHTGIFPIIFATSLQ